MLRSKGLLGLVIACGTFASANAFAELKALDDDTMSEMTGQAFMSVTEVEGLAAGESFSRMTLTGIETDLRMSVGSMSIGERAVAGSSTTADIAATGFQLGQTSGAAFLAYSPYFEWAKVNDEVVGVRMGFMEAKGDLTGTINSFTGNIGLKVDMDGTGTDVRNAQLLTDAGAATNYRATHIGVDDGSGTCGSGCAPLTNLTSLSVGKDDGAGNAEITKDFFFSMQKQSVNWLSNDNAGTAITAGSEVFFNIPTSMTVNMSDLTGVPYVPPAAQATYVDTGAALF